MEKVLLMMNAPTNIAMPAKISMKVLNDEMFSCSAFWSSATTVAPVTTCTSASVAAAEVRGQRALRDAGPRGERDAVDLARAGRAAAGPRASVKSTEVAPPAELAPPKVAMPEMVNVRGAPVVSTFARSPTWYPAVSAECWSMTISSAARGAWPAASSVRVERVDGHPVRTEQRDLGGVADRLPVPVDDLGVAVHLHRGLVHAVDLSAACRAASASMRGRWSPKERLSGLTPRT